MTTIENVVVCTENHIYKNVDVEFSTHWVRIHVSANAEKWIPRDRIELINVTNNA